MAVRAAAAAKSPHRAAFEASAADARVPDFRILPAPEASAPPDEFQAPVLYAEPLDWERDRIGVDLASDPRWRHTLEEARDTGVVVASPPVHLPLWPDEFGIVTVAPTYGDDVPPAEVAARRARIRGFGVAVARVDELVRDALERVGHPYIVARITDVTGTAVQASGSLLREVPSDAMRWSTHVEVGGRVWLADDWDSDETNKEIARDFDFGENEIAAAG